MRGFPRTPVVLITLLTACGASDSGAQDSGREATTPSSSTAVSSDTPRSMPDVCARVLATYPSEGEIPSGHEVDAMTADLRALVEEVPANLSGPVTAALLHLSPIPDQTGDSYAAGRKDIERFCP